MIGKVERPHTLRILSAVLTVMLPLLVLGEPAEQRQARIERLQKAVLAPCCYAEPVSQHQSEIAVKMRLEIAQWVAMGRTDREILGTYADRYSRKVLVDPRTVPRLWVLWVQWLALVLAVITGIGILRRWRRPGADFGRGAGLG